MRSRLFRLCQLLTVIVTVAVGCACRAGETGGAGAGSGGRVLRVQGAGAGAADLRFDWPLDLLGTPFHKRVWRALSGIPIGETRSYGEIATQIGRSGAARAVGGACGANPVPIVVPCHRIIGAGGALTGYGGGLDRKAWLLDHEGVHYSPPRTGETAGEAAPAHR